MTSLLSRAQPPNSEGRIQNITPESADWKYVGFDFFKLKAGQTLKKETGGREVCLVLVTGKASVKTLHESWDNLGERMSIFLKIQELMANRLTLFMFRMMINFLWQQKRIWNWPCVPHREKAVSLPV